MGVIEIRGFVCERCRHRWAPRSGEMPMVCPLCKSPYWNKPKKKRAK